MGESDIELTSSSSNHVKKPTEINDPRRKSRQYSIPSIGPLHECRSELSLIRDKKSSLLYGLNDAPPWYTCIALGIQSSNYNVYGLPFHIHITTIIAQIVVLKFLYHNLFASTIV
ncbi:hypothetical protein Avbf_02835 [Armadillidium vulgare]|nr:hypothetical protein Avbf_02835 [Armadillidium vulgare]